MTTEQVLLAELTRHAVLVGKMEATMQSLQKLLAQPVCEPTRWLGVSMIQQCLDDCRTVLPVKHDARPLAASPVASKPNGKDDGQLAIALPPPKAQSAAERRRAIMGRALAKVTLPG